MGRSGEHLLSQVVKLSSPRKEPVTPCPSSDDAIGGINIIYAVFGQNV